MSRSYIDEILSAEGYLSCFHNEYSARADQIELARHIDDAIRDGNHLLVEAPEDHERMIPFLVPAIYHAALDRRRVIIFTTSIENQNHLIADTLPRLDEALPWGFSFTRATEPAERPRQVWFHGEEIIVASYELLFKHLSVQKGIKKSSKTRRASLLPRFDIVILDQADQLAELARHFFCVRVQRSLNSLPFRLARFLNNTLYSKTLCTIITSPRLTTRDSFASICAELGVPSPRLIAVKPPYSAAPLSSTPHSLVLQGAKQ